MRFKRLVIEGYKSFRYPTEIAFPNGQDGKSIFLIGGMNGAGKTSFMEAINLCLYSAKPDLITRFFEGSCGVERARVSFKCIECPLMNS
jgi:DNA sulfur modification protein DndD